MNWVIEPLRSFAEVATVLADDCTGGGTLNSCNCKGGLVSCTTKGALAIGS